jgi:hypothetical protein
MIRRDQTANWMVVTEIVWRSDKGHHSGGYRHRHWIFNTPRNEKQVMESCLIGLRVTAAVDPAKKLLD